jgi:hypothetical protein
MVTWQTTAFLRGSFSETCSIWENDAYNELERNMNMNHVFFNEVAENSNVNTASRNIMEYLKLKGQNKHAHNGMHTRWALSI